MTAQPPSDADLDLLLSVIKTGEVIPVVGPDLVTAPDSNGIPMPLDQYLAPLLAERLGLKVTLAPDATISDVAIQARKAVPPLSKNVPLNIAGLLEELRIPTPEPLRNLARIRPFRFFVSLTFDGLLAHAIKEVRGGQAEPVDERAYSRKRAPKEVDLAVDFDWQKKRSTVVFHLFGRVSSEFPHLRDYVITEEDRLEWVHALQSPEQQPDRLFEQLHTKNLLFVGCRFPDWLARFAIRAAKGVEFSVARDDVMEFVADASATGEPSFTMFVDQFSESMQVFRGSASAFVDALARRWCEQHPDAPGTTPAPTPKSVRPRPTTMRSGFVFISYASEHREEAIELRATLEKDLEVWLDVDQLGAGADWEDEIRRGIAKCAVFVPLISHTAARQQNGDEYFRREWAAALDRLPFFTGIDRPFIVPVALDDVDQQTSGIPAKFWTKHFGRLDRLDSDEAMGVLKTRLISIVEKFHEQQRGHP